MSTPIKPSCPMDARDVIETYFLEHRAKLIDIAAFLDRISRARNPETGIQDFRMVAMRKALEVVASAEQQKARKVQMIFSDPTTEPLESAADLKGAYGAYPGKGNDK